MSTDYKRKNNDATALGMIAEIKWWLLASGIIIVGLVIGGSFIDDRVGQILAGLLTAIITTLVSVFATYHSSNAAQSRAAKDELTRYGLLAWRNLDSLQLKVRQELEQTKPENSKTLNGWLLDIDQAKWAWQDILREVFDLQERLQAETYELARDYKEKIGAAKPSDRLKLEAEKQAHFARLITSSPLPLKIPAEVSCPNCSNPVAIMIGQNTGDTSTLRCPTCRRGFHAHRAADGSLFTRKQGAINSEPKGQDNAENSRLAALEAVRDTFATAPNEIIIGGWKDFFPALTEKLRASELGPSDARAIQKWLFKLHAFRLLGPEQGIGLPVPAAQLIDFVEERYVKGIMDIEGNVPQAERVCKEIYGINSDRLAHLQTLVADLGTMERQ